MDNLASQALGFVYDRLLGDFPRVVRIETTNACNAKCLICPHPTMTRSPSLMSEDLFRSIVDECSRHDLSALHLHNFGEPMLDKKLPARIAYAKQAGIRRVKIISNGSLITEAKAEAVIRAGLDEIKISFDGATPQEFEKIRFPLKFDVVVDNILNLVRVRDRLQGKTKVTVSCAYTSDKSRTMERLAAHVDQCSFDKLHNWATSDTEFLKANASSLSRKRKPCSRVWRTFTILSHGDVALCCLDYDGSEIMGQLGNGSSIKEIWNGERYRRLRRLHRGARQENIPLCANCSKSYW